MTMIMLIVNKYPKLYLPQTCNYKYLLYCHKYLGSLGLKINENMRTSYFELEAILDILGLFGIYDSHLGYHTA